MKIIRSHKVTITYQKNKTDLFKPNTKEIQKITKFLLRLICAFPTEISIRFCGIEEMTKTNGRFRNIYKPTDVLSFMPDRSFHPDFEFLGDILICVPVCQKQALTEKHSISAELIKMLIHALVHLKGFDHDRNESAARVMSQLERSLQTELINHFGQTHLEKETV